MHVHECIHVCVFACMHARVYEHIAACACVCMHAYMCVCVRMHACMYILQSPLSIEVGLAGFAPPSNIEKLPTPMINTVIVDKGLV